MSKIYAQVRNSASITDGTVVRILSVGDDAALCQRLDGGLVALNGSQLEAAPPALVRRTFRRILDS